jgi:hypothetical protein
MITSEAVERTCSEIGEYTDEQMVSEFERFFRAQPALCDFVFELTHDSGQRIQELSLFLTYMVFRANESSAAGAARVKREDIEEAYRQTESWMTLISEAEETQFEGAILKSLEREAEPYLLQYVISELNEPMEDGEPLNEEEKGEVFFLLKTVISSLRSSEP